MGSPSYNIVEERFTFHGQPQAHRPITRVKNKLSLNSKLRDNPRLRDLVININDSLVKEQPPKPKKKRVAKPKKAPKAKVDKDKGLKLLSKVLDTLSYAGCSILINFGHRKSFSRKALPPLHATFSCTWLFCTLHQILEVQIQPFRVCEGY